MGRRTLPWAAAVSAADSLDARFAVANHDIVAVRFSEFDNCHTTRILQELVEGQMKLGNAINNAIVG